LLSAIQPSAGADRNSGYLEVNYFDVDLDHEGLSLGRQFHAALTVTI